MMALGIIDKLEPEDLTGGRIIAGGGLAGRGFWREMVLGADFFTTEDFRRFFELGGFFVFANFFAKAFFFRAASDFVFFTIEILLDI